MYRYILVSLLLALPLTARAEVSVLNDIKAQNGVQLSADELRQLMPGANVANRTDAGNTRRWINNADGKLIASSDNRAAGSRATHGGTSNAQGTWHVADNGTYCVTLEWKSASENWCRYIFKVGSKYFGVNSAVSGTAKAFEYEISK